MRDPVAAHPPHRSIFKHCLGGKISRRSARLIPLTLAAIAGVALSACKSDPPANEAPMQAVADVAPPATAADVSEDAPPLDDATAQAAYRPRPAATVQWLDMAVAQGSQPVKAAPVLPPPTPVPPQADTAPVAQAPMHIDDPKTQAAQPAEQTATPLDRATLVSRLNDELATTESPAMRRALQAVALSMLSPDKRIDPRLIEPLDASQRDQLARFQILLTEVAERLEAGQPVDAAEVLKPLEAAPTPDGEQPITLREVKLCRSVSGFGVYEPFESYRFQAGRGDNRAIVYAELEHYIVRPQGELHEVKLEQELVLYTEGDGLIVWRQPAQRVVDRARRVRRDFYVVQLIQLPANLGVGRYALKVRVTDLHSGAIDEETLPLDLVADATLIQPNQPAEKPKESKLPEPPDVRSILPDLLPEPPTK